MKSPIFGDTEPELSVHIRTKRQRKWSIIGDAAIQVGKDILEIGGDGKLHKNGEEVDIVEAKLYSVTKSPVREKIKLYTFDFGNGRKLEVKANTRSAMLFTNLSGNFPHGTVGLLGSPHKTGMFARDEPNIKATNVDSFVQSWQVKDSDPKLFKKIEGPQYPTKCCYFNTCTNAKGKRRLKEFHQIHMEEAVAVCSSHPPGPKRQFCVDDVIATGDLDTGKESFYG